MCVKNIFEASYMSVASASCRRGHGREAHPTLLLLRRARIVGGIDVFDLERTHGVDLHDAFALAQGEMLHPRRHDAKGAHGHLMRGCFVEFWARPES